MIVRELYATRDDGVVLYITYSDKKVMIRQDGTGILFDSAVDVDDSTNTYTETDIPCEGKEVSDAEAIAILLGGDTDEAE